MRDDVVRDEVVDALDRDVVDALLAGRLDADDLLPIDATGARKLRKRRVVQSRRQRTGMDAASPTRIAVPVRVIDTQTARPRAQRQRSVPHPFPGHRCELSGRCGYLSERSFAVDGDAGILSVRRDETLVGDHVRLNELRETRRAMRPHLERRALHRTAVLDCLVLRLVKRRANAEPQEEGLNVPRDERRNGLEKDNALPDVAVAVPERGEESSDFLFGQLEDVLRYPLLRASRPPSISPASARVAALPPEPLVAQPHFERRRLAMSANGAVPRRHDTRHPSHLLHVREDNVVEAHAARVLEVVDQRVVRRMERHWRGCAEGAVADEVRENLQPRAFALVEVTTVARSCELLRSREEIAFGQFIEPAPAVLGEKLVVSSPLDRSAVPKLHPVNPTHAVVDPSGNTRMRGAEIVVDALDKNVIVLLQFIDPEPPAGARVKHKRFA